MLSVDEQRCLLAAASTSKAKWLHAALVLSMTSAMRRGELFGLRRKDIRYEESVIFLAETKAGGSRLVPLGPQSIAALRELDAAAPDGPDAPFLPVGEAGSISTRFTVTVRRAKRAYEEECRAAEKQAIPGFLSDLRWHDMRHHAITAVCANGDLTLAEVMAISGHRTAAQAMRYSHVNVSKLAAKLARLQPLDVGRGARAAESSPSTRSTNLKVTPACATDESGASRPTRTQSNCQGAFKDCPQHRSIRSSP